ncbi:PurK Phosphoribosylaminoimidazole carboxylase (NCAIR synthetase) [Rhabdaerophilaceae bacterium]
MLAPGSRIGILGGGQLGRMLAIAAARLGFRCHIYCPEPESPAFDVAAEQTVASYDDHAALQRFAKTIDVATFEFENVPVEALNVLAGFKRVAPSADALSVAQDRLAEKTFANSLGLATAPFGKVDSWVDLQSAAERIGLPAILKTRRFGYDGKGQVKIAVDAELDEAFASLKGAPAILEGFVRFSREVSVVAARTREGLFSSFAVTENEHRHHILDRSIVPARISGRAQQAAIEAARAIGEGLRYVGVFAVEFFVADGPDGETIVVNEIAPRVHNSGHWTLDAAVTCQFEQHIRAIAGWPLGDPAMRCPVEMINLVGADLEGWSALVAEPRTKIHLYGKGESRPGRKMGHANRLLG